MRSTYAEQNFLCNQLTGGELRAENTDRVALLQVAFVHDGISMLELGLARERDLESRAGGLQLEAVSRDGGDHSGSRVAFVEFRIVGPDQGRSEEQGGKQSVHASIMAHPGKVRGSG